ncbi:reticulon family protein isoform X2 [Wolffia australiana]
MLEHSESAAENILNNSVESINETMHRQKSGKFSEDQGSMSAQMNRLFGRQKSVHSLFGGGKSADVLLWRNKKISLSVLSAATAVWVLFEWLNYHLLTLICFVMVIGMGIQFVWSNASGVLSRSSSQVPRLVLPEELFVNIGIAVGGEVNRFLGLIQDISTGRNLKQFILVVCGLWAAAIIGSWCNFLSVLYIGFVGAHTLPVLYEKYEDQVDDFVYKIFGHVRHHYRKLDEGVLSKIPKANLLTKKIE